MSTALDMSTGIRTYGASEDMCEDLMVAVTQLPSTPDLQWCMTSQQLYMQNLIILGQALQVGALRLNENRRLCGWSILK